jgi:hypothetical protein
MTEDTASSAAFYPTGKTNGDPFGASQREPSTRGHPSANVPYARDNGIGLAGHSRGARSTHCVILPTAPTALPALEDVRIPRNGLQLPRRLPFDAWLEVGRRLAAVVNSSAWCLGDWLIYGEIFFTGRYREAVERTSLDYQTLRNYAWVARKIPFSRRRETLSFGHHAEVAALPEPEQDYWLRKAHDLGWSRNQIRREIRESLRQRNADVVEQQQPRRAGALPATGEVRSHEPAALSELTIQMKVTTDQIELFRQAAGQSGYSIDDWALLVLDQAARNDPPV